MASLASSRRNMNAGAASFSPSSAGSDFMKFPTMYAKVFQPLASLRRLEVNFNKKFALQDSDDSDAILAKLLDFAVEVGFDRAQAQMLLEEGFPRFFYFVLLSKVADESIRVDADFVALMRESLQAHEDWDDSLKRRFAVFITSRSTLTSAPQEANTFKYVFASAVPAVTGGAAAPAPEVAATQATSVLNWKEHMKDYFGIRNSYTVRWSQRTDRRRMETCSLRRMCPSQEDTDGWPSIECPQRHSAPK